MRRMQLAEIHDQAWFPGFLRSHVTGALQQICDVASVYRPIAHRLRTALRKAGTNQVLDLCAGAGGPWLWLYREVEQPGYPSLQVCLTDKYPNIIALERAQIISGGTIEFRADSVDATRVPAELHGFRTLFTSFHHFPPREAEAILQDSVDRKQGIAIFEVPGRHLVTILLTFLVPVASILLAPFARARLGSRLLWTWLIPIVPAVLLIDGLVSCLRAYSPRELAELTGGISADGYEWEIGEEKGGALRIPITYLIGYPSDLCAERQPS